MLLEFVHTSKVFFKDIPFEFASRNANPYGIYQVSLKYGFVIEKDIERNRSRRVKNNLQKSQVQSPKGKLNYRLS